MRPTPIESDQQLSNETNTYRMRPTPILLDPRPLELFRLIIRQLAQINH